MARTPSTMLELGSPATSFCLPDFDGHLHAFEDFAAAHHQIEVFVNHVTAEGVLEPLDHHGGFVVRFGRLHPQPTSVKNTAKKASITITMKIAWTTAIVVRRPTSSASLFTCMP